VVNVKYWRFDQPMPRKLLGGPLGSETVPDVPNFSWVEYGTRCGLPRLLELLTGRGMPASASVSASDIEAYPQAGDAIIDVGWEFIGHGLHHQGLALTHQRCARG